jgi:hypothetical protein
MPRLTSGLKNWLDCCTDTCAVFLASRVGVSLTLPMVSQVANGIAAWHDRRLHLHARCWLRSCSKCGGTCCLGCCCTLQLYADLRQPKQARSLPLLPAQLSGNLAPYLLALYRLCVLRNTASHSGS